MGTPLPLPVAPLLLPAAGGGGGGGGIGTRGIGGTGGITAIGFRGIRLIGCGGDEFANETACLTLSSEECELADSAAAGPTAAVEDGQLVDPVAFLAFTFN